MLSANTQEQDTRLFRFIVLLTLILIFIGVATTRIWELRIAAERIGVMHTIGALKSALGIHLSQSVVHGGINSLGSLHLANPIALLQNEDDEAPYGIAAGIAPQNYLGEFTTAEAPQESGVWYFDTEQRVLVYRVNFTDHFHSSNQTLPELARYRMALSYTDRNDNGTFETGQDEINGIGIEAVDDYTWQLEPDLPPVEPSE